MSVKNPSEWKSSSFAIRIERHEALRKLLDDLHLSSPAHLANVLTEDPAATVAALRPLVAKFEENQVKQGSQKARQKELAGKLATLPAEELERLLKLAQNAPAA